MRGNCSMELAIGLWAMSLAYVGGVACSLSDSLRPAFAVNRMQGRVLEIIQDPAQQTTLLSLAAEHKAMSTKIDLMQLVRTIFFPSSSSLCTIVQQLETFTAQQATLQASTNALQPLVFATEKLSTRLESFDSTTVGALAKLEGLVVELAGNLNDIRDIGRSSTNTSRKRHSSISPPLSPEFPPLKRRKFDLAPSSPEIVPSSQPNSVGDDDSVDEPPSAVPTARSSTALPQLCPILFTPTQVEYNLNNQISPVPTPCPLAKQKTNLTQFHSSRSLKNTDGMVDSSQDANITEHSRPSFPQPPQIPPGREVHDHKQTPCQVGISHTFSNNFTRPILRLSRRSPTYFPANLRCLRLLKHRILINQYQPLQLWPFIPPSFLRMCK